MKAVIVVPAFNESAVIHQVLKSLPKKLKGLSILQVLVVDDGSTDETARLAHLAGAKVTRHLLNRGAGAATKTGLEWAKKSGADLAITFDADGQHNPADLERLIAPIIAKRAELVIGSRLLKRQKMPPDRFILNWLANLATFLFFGVFHTDSQSGLRAFSQKALHTIDIKSDRMEFSSEILVEAKKHKLRVLEVPTAAIYTAYSRQKGQKTLHALPIFLRFLIKVSR